MATKSPSPQPRTRSVRLDAEAERALAEIRQLTGDSISKALKRGLLAAQKELAGTAFVRPYDIYRKLDLGPGGYSLAPARDAKRAVREIIRRKHSR